MIRCLPGADRARTCTSINGHRRRRPGSVREGEKTNTDTNRRCPGDRRRRRRYGHRSSRSPVVGSLTGPVKNRSTFVNVAGPGGETTARCELRPRSPAARRDKLLQKWTRFPHDDIALTVGVPVPRSTRAVSFRFKNVSFGACRKTLLTIFHCDKTILTTVYEIFLRKKHLIAKNDVTYTII